MDSVTLELLGRMLVGHADPMGYVDWAIAQLEAGRVTKNIQILAGLPKPLSAFEAEDYFYKALGDLGWQVPNEEAALWHYAEVVAHDIVSGTRDPVEGCREIYRIYRALGYPGSLVAWLYLDEELEVGSYADLRGERLRSAITAEAKRLIAHVEALPDLGAGRNERA
jgi:hypothetical protein